MVFWCLIFLGGLQFAAIGAPISQNQALDAAAQWHRLTPAPMGGHAGKIGKIKTYSNAAGEARFHVVDLEPTGYVVIAADDALEPVIAFSLKGRFAAKAQNPLYDLLLKDTENRVRHARADATAQHPLSQVVLAARKHWGMLTAATATGAVTAQAASTVTSVSDECVAPLVQSEWSQSTNDSGNAAVYNYYTPPDAAGNVNNDVCGCVATAMAQVMRYWQWPQSGVGTASFPITVNGVSEQRALRGGNGSGGPYDWADMVLAPGSGVTAKQCQAIGALTADAGVANNMEYTAEESGAIPSSAVLRTVFKYAGAASSQDTLSDLLVAIRTNLDAGQPVTLSIYGPPGGHEVVCDGYGYNLSTLYDHINVGWGPAQNALDNIWYNLPTISPPDTGYTFNSVEACYFNINPTVTGEIISGRITQANGTPVSGVVVNLSGATVRTGTTNQEGIFAFNGVPSNTTWTVAPTGSSNTYAPASALVATGISGDWGDVGDKTADFTAKPILSGTYTVTPSAGANGSISPSTAQSVASGSSVTFTATPNAGYVVNQWLLNGAVAQTGSTSYTVASVTANDSVQVTFALPSALAQMQSPAPGNTLTSSTATFQWNAGTGNSTYILDVGSSQGADDIYYSGDLAAGTLSQAVTGIPTDGRTLYVRLWSESSTGWGYNDYTYTAATAAGSYTVTPSAGANGSIAPSTPQSVANGGSVTFTATPNSGYQVNQWLLNGAVVQTNETSFTVSNVTSDESVSVTFGLIPASAQMQNPVPGSTFPSSSVTFQWSAGTGASGYFLYVGSSQGAYDIFNSGNIADTVFSEGVSGIPTDGRTVYVRLWTEANGAWLYNDYTYTAASSTTTFTVTPSTGPNGSISPSTAQTVAAGGSVAFAASPNSGYVVNEWLLNGTAAQYGLNNYTLSGVSSNDTVAVIFSPASAAAQIQSPAPGSTLLSASATFEWNSAAGSSGYQLYVGTSLGGSDVFNSGNLGTGTFSAGVSSLPVNGSTIYVRLLTEINGTWLSNDYTYIGASTTAAQMQSPVPGSPLSSSSVTFQWSAGVGSTAYFLYVGSSQGAYDIFNSGDIAAGTLSEYVTGLPVNGATVYVRLWTEVGGNWLYNDYTYAAYVSAGGYYWSNYAGLPGVYGYANGIGSGAEFDLPSGITIDGSGNLYVGDSGNNVIRKISPTGMVTALAGNPSASGTADGPGGVAQFNNPRGVAVAGNGYVYVADAGNNTIRKISPTGMVTTLAGTPGLAGTANGIGSAAQFDIPRFVAVDGSNNVYVADYGNNTIRKISPTGSVSTLAGTPGVSGTDDGPAAAALFNAPSGLAVDKNGNIFVADLGNYTIREISAPGLVKTVAGSPGYAGSADGTGGNALFSAPDGLALDGNGNLYVADNTYSTIRMVAPDAEVTTIGGTPGITGVSDGYGPLAQFTNPRAIASSAGGIVYVADSFNHRITKGALPQDVGSLQVTINPAQAVTAGAKWQVDGGAWQASAYTLNNVSPGAHTISFSTLGAWITPASQGVTVSASQTAVATATYVPIPVPVISSGTNVTALEGEPFSYQITASNYPTSFGASGLPPGLVCDETSGMITGAPTQSGTFTAALTANNAGGAGSALLSIAVGIPPKPVISSPSSATGTNDVGFYYQIVANNYPTGYSASGLPPGVGYSGSTGMLSGIPTASGTFPATISAINAGGTDSVALSVTIVEPPPRITSSYTATGITGTAFNYQISASNSPESYGATGLPAGLGVDPSTGMISGTPAQGGTFAATISATNAGGTVSHEFDLTITMNFKGVNGTYDGLGAVDGTNDGLFTLSVTNRGAFTGRLTLANTHYILGGKFSTYGTYARTVTQGRTTLQIALALDSSLPGVSGTIDAASETGSNSYSVEGGLLGTFKASTLPTAIGRTYTAIIPVASGTNAGMPAMPGYSTMTVAATGAVHIAGKLGDGTAFSVRGRLHADGKTWTLFTPLYAGKNPGSIAGAMTFEPLQGSDCDGMVDWIKPAQTRGSYYPGGFSGMIDVTAAKYASPALTSGTGTFTLGGGDLPDSAICESWTVSTGAKMLVGGTNGVSLTLTPGTGAFRGYFLFPVTNTRTPFGGVIYQKPAPAAGFGLFPGTDQCGGLEITQ